MEQLSIFDAPQLLLGDYFKAIEKAEWNSIPRIIESIDKLNVDLPGWEVKKKFWKSELNRIKRILKKSPKEIALFWESFQENLKKDSLKIEAKYLEKIFFSQIIQRLEKDAINYLTNTMHPAYCLIKLGKYSEASEMTSKYCNEMEENSLIRCYQAFCLFKMKNEGSARTALTFALFFDPFQVPIEFVFYPNIKKLLSALEIEYTDPKLLLACWPFEAWIDRLVEIPPNKQFANKIKGIYAGNVFRKEIINNVDRQIYFNHLLYLAEVARKNTKIISKEIIDLRKKMNSVNPEAFKRYVKRIQ